MNPVSDLVQLNWMMVEILWNVYVLIIQVSYRD